MKSGNSPATTAEPKKFSFVPELVPRCLFGRSAYRMLGKRKAWKNIQQDARITADHCCVTCGSNKRQLSCHEKWDYDDSKATATLVGFEINCQSCHMVSHAGRAMAHGFENELITHLCQMNQCTEAEAHGMIDAAMVQWRKRNERDWKIIVAPAMLKMYPELAGLPDYVPPE